MRDEKVLSIIEELMRVVVYSLAVFGGITILACIFEHYHGIDTIGLGFFENISWHVVIYALSVIICFTDIIPINISKLMRISLTIIITYCFTIFYLSHCPIARSMGSMEFVIIVTIWYFFIAFCVIGSWIIYDWTTSRKYNKYLKDYQNSKK